MASENPTPSGIAILGALAAGTRIDAPNSPEPYEGAGDPEDFVVAWVKLWRSIGNDVYPSAPGAKSASLAVSHYFPGGFPLMGDMPPHLALWNEEQHSGATRALEWMLRYVPGARQSLRDYICGAPSPQLSDREG